MQQIPAVAEFGETTTVLQLVLDRLFGSAPAGILAAMPMIRVEGLIKEFRRPKQFTGPLATLRTMLTRRYETTRVVDDIDFELAAGEVVGYLGSNGAGKSTTIKMLTGVLVPTAGTVEVGGLVPWRDRKRNAKQIGVVFGQRSQLWWDLPLRHSLDMIGRLYDVPHDLWLRRVRMFAELLDMEPFLNTPVRQLSLGQRMRGDLAAAMIYQPSVLYLDEPTVGLDVVAKERMRDFIEETNREHGTTVVLTTHDIGDIERLCRRIIVIDRGTKLYDGRLETLKTRYAPFRQIVVRLVSSERLEITGVREVIQDGPEATIVFDPREIDAASVMRAVLDRHQVQDIGMVEPSLEGVIHQIYSDRKVSA